MSAAVAAPTSVRRSRRSGSGGTQRAVLGLAGVVCLVLAIEILPRAEVVDPRFMPPFSEICVALVERLGTSEFWLALWDTITTWAIGLTIAMVAGIVLGILIGSITLLREATASTIEFLRPIPSVALIPVAVLLFGTDREGTLLLVVYASFWQVLIQVLYGVQDVDPVARDTARTYRFSTWTQARTVIWPTALPYVVTGFRLAATVALILTVTGELLISTPGLGNILGVAQSSGAVASMYALVIVIGLLGVVVNLATRALERRILRWHPSVRRETAS
ncbi:ABC transporter permease [Georgenia alba]|uniref:ABC transporter permease n=1 Tax=Georgenia alba TaxID=2233858 RepID=A0ABW2QBA6_9MICO